MNQHLKDFILQQADNSLILGHRISEWCGVGPSLEQDIALTNIALDLLGQTRLYYQHLATLEEGMTEDDYAFLRKEREYKNILLVEHENVDFAYTIIRSFFFDTFHLLLLKELINIDYVGIKNVAIQALNEVKYHFNFSKEWTIRLGDGTDVSHEKMQTAANELFNLTGELFILSEADQFMVDNYQIDFDAIKNKWEAIVKEVFDEATLQVPESGYMQKGGKQGIHSEKLGFLLSDLQYMQRAYPNMQW